MFWHPPDNVHTRYKRFDEGTDEHKGCEVFLSYFQLQFSFRYITSHYESFSFSFSMSNRRFRLHPRSCALRSVSLVSHWPTLTGSQSVGLASRSLARSKVRRPSGRRAAADPVDVLSAVIDAASQNTTSVPSFRLLDIAELFVCSLRRETNPRGRKQQTFTSPVRLEERSLEMCGTWCCARCNLWQEQLLGAIT